MNLKETVDKYLLENYTTIDIAKELPDFRWKDVADKIGKNIAGEYCRGRWRKINKTKNVSSPPTVSSQKFTYSSGKEDKNTGTKEWTFTASNIPTEEEIISHFNIDTTKWKIVNIYHKTSFGGSYSITVQTNLLKLEQSIDYKSSIENIINDLNISVLNRPKLEIPQNPNKEKRYCLYLPIFDLHAGKLAHRDSSGDDYDLKIALQRYRDAVKNLVWSAFASYNFEKICIVLGQDLLHVDNRQNLTSGGTPQDADTRFEKMYEEVTKMLIEVIDFLVSFAPVDAIIVRGNHAEHLEYTLGVTLKYVFSKHKEVNIDASASLRKYYKYGATGIMLSHGDKEKHDSLPLIFATENKELWANTEYHQIHLGHLHTTRTKVFLSTNEYSGCQVSIYPSLSGDDFWHTGKGFNLNKKRAIAVIYDRDKGEVAKLNYCI